MAKQAIANANEMDLARLKKRIRTVFLATRTAESSYIKARDFAALRRLELGQLLMEARAHWPRSGPNAKGWGDFLRSVEINDDVALDAMRYAGYVEKTSSGRKQGKLPSLRDAGVRRESLNEERDPEDDGQGSRGAWCTPKIVAQSVGSWDLDPFTNPRSHIRATYTCMLERGDNGFGVSSPRVAGEYFTSAAGVMAAHKATRVWLQPDYGYVLEAVHHYGHTQFCALLRLDTSTEWFDYLHQRSELILIPRGERIQFDPPPDVEASSNPFPHGLFYAQAKDATEQIRALCYEWRIRAV